MILPILSLLAGIVLGQRFKVLVLLPGMAVVMLIASGLGITEGLSLFHIVTAVISAIASLQIGYLTGGALRYLFAAARAGKLRTGFNEIPSPGTALRSPAIRT